MKLFEKLKAFLAVPADKPALLLAQINAFSRQMPLLYFILVINIWFVSATHMNVAPAWLTVSAPSAFSVIAVLRIRGWLKMRNAVYQPEEAARRLRSTIFLVAVLGTGMTMWSLALLPYGTPYHQGHVAFFMSATMVACVFCLMHLRAAAMLLSFIVVVPFCVAFAMQQNMVLAAISANLALVTLGMMYVLSNHHDDFATMVEQRVDLLRINEETRRLNDENRRLAHHDALTGLPNRRSFVAAIESRTKTAAADPDGKPFAVGLIDLDGFKSVNDLYGHAAGDALLMAASQRLKMLTGRGVSIARLGGDEFGFIADDVRDILGLGNMICTALAEPYGFENARLEIGASCGIALFPESCATTSELLEFADYALYQVKDARTGQAQLFSASLRNQLLASQQIDQALRHANLEEEMCLYYQPVFSHASQKIVALEALARWRAPKIGEVPPKQFFATAERSVLIHKVTLTLLRRLLKDMPAFPPDVRVSFNLSAKCLVSSDSMLRLMSLIQNSDVDPRRIIFEVTETALVSNFDAAMRALQLLRNLGSTIALDDFGTGYSSLSYVHQLPLDMIKIDRSFVADMCQDAKALKIVQTIVGLSKELNFRCVAEGVENQVQADALGQIGCDLMQGFHFAVPMPHRETEALLASSVATLHASTK